MRANSRAGSSVRMAARGKNTRGCQNVMGFAMIFGTQTVIGIVVSSVVTAGIIFVCLYFGVFAYQPGAEVSYWRYWMLGLPVRIIETICESKGEDGNPQNITQLVIGDGDALCVVGWNAATGEAKPRTWWMAVPFKENGMPWNVFTYSTPRTGEDTGTRIHFDNSASGGQVTYHDTTGNGYLDIMIDRPAKKRIT